MDLKDLSILTSHDPSSKPNVNLGAMEVLSNTSRACVFKGHIVMRFATMQLAAARSLASLRERLRVKERCAPRSLSSATTPNEREASCFRACAVVPKTCVLF